MEYLIQNIEWNFDIIMIKEESRGGIKI